MKLTGTHKLLKLKKKNIGNTLLIIQIEKLIFEIENSNWIDKSEMVLARKDVDCVYEDFYFFDLHIHRSLILIEFGEFEEAAVVWCGSHDEYELVFKNNKDVIRKWLKVNEWID
jgi:mRNA interferase HigB